MATITTLNSGDTGPVSRGVINTNFSNLNTDKIETSFLDTDSTLSADSDNKLATQKATKAYVDNNTSSVETTTGVTHSLTTVAGQTVLVFAKGNVATGSGSNRVVTLAYNGVSKDTVNVVSNTSAKACFALGYSEIPGAGTHDITVTISADTIENVKIFVTKL